MDFLGWPSSRHHCRAHSQNVSQKLLQSPWQEPQPRCHMGCKGTSAAALALSVTFLMPEVLPAGAQLRPAEKCAEKGAQAGAVVHPRAVPEPGFPGSSFPPWFLCCTDVPGMLFASSSASVPSWSLHGLCPSWLSCCRQHKEPALLLLLLTQALHIPVDAKLSKLRLFPSLPCLCGVVFCPHFPHRCQSLHPIPAAALTPLIPPSWRGWGRNF